MSVAQAIQHFCRVEHNEVPFAVRRWQLLELVAVVGAALIIQALAGSGNRGPAWSWVDLIAQLALPLAAAWTLRRTTGRRAFAIAAVLEAGLVAGLLIAANSVEIQDPRTHAYVAAAMVWVLGSNPRTSTNAALGAATILALAFVVATFI